MSLRTLQLIGPRCAVLTTKQPVSLLGLQPAVQKRLYSQNPSERYLEIKSSPGRGLGAFAKIDVPAFTCIVSDLPLIKIDEGEDLPEIYVQFKKLEDEERTRVMKYDRQTNHQRDERLKSILLARGNSSDIVDEMVKLASVFQANAFNIKNGEKPGNVQRVMFPTMSRINHSCAPNAHCNYDTTSGRMTTYTLKDIDKGQEIEISYFSILLPRAERQARASKWGFKCTCAVCEELSSSDTGSEFRRERVRTIESGLLRMFIAGASREELHLRCNEAKEMVDIILSDKSLTPQLPIAYDYIAMTQVIQYELDKSSRMLEDASENLALAVEAESNITGAENQATQNRKDKLIAIHKAK